MDSWEDNLLLLSEWVSEQAPGFESSKEED